MKPGSLESLRGIQVAIAEAIIPELQAAYAQDVAQVGTMLIESLAAEQDSLAEDLKADSTAVRDLLRRSVSVLSPLSKGNEQLVTLVREVEGTVNLPGSSSLRISELTSENDALRAALEHTLVTLEDMTAGPEQPEALALREAIYSHLRIGAAAGWSFWDVASFRERMAALRSEHK